MVPFLLAAASLATKHPAFPATVLSSLFTGVDEHGWPWHKPGREPRARRLSDVLTAVALATEADATSRERWLSLAEEVVWARTDEIVRAKHRGAYRRMAELVVAHAEAVGIAQGRAAAAAILRRTNERYPRHVAFRREVDLAAGRSPIVAR